jgi:transcriptional regulator with XRE-family HTH domain
MKPKPEAAQPIVLRTEGQRMLLHVQGSLDALASALGTPSKQSIVNWRSKGMQPSAVMRARMQEAFGIPVQAWSQRPTERPPGPINGHAEAEPQPGTTLQDCMALLATIKREQRTAGLMASERVKLADAEARILKLRADLEARAELSEDRYVREHPAWIRARNTISAVLKAYPEAARAVADALERLHM